MNRILSTSWMVAAMLPGLVSAANHVCHDPANTPVNPTSAYDIHDDGTVTDPRTGLMWKRCGEGRAYDAATASCTGDLLSFKTWQAAQQAAAARSAFAGHDDWRLPNIKELYSLAELCQTDPKINTAVFPFGTNAQEGVVRWWSSSPLRNYPFLVTGAGEPPVQVRVFNQSKGETESSSFDVSAYDTPYAIRLVRNVEP